MNNPFELKVIVALTDSLYGGGAVMSVCVCFTVSVTVATMIAAVVSLS